MGRRGAAGVSRFTRVAVVTGRHGGGHVVITCEHGGNRIPGRIGGCFRDNGRCWILTAGTTPVRWSWRRHSPTPSGPRSWLQPPAVCSSTSIARSDTHTSFRRRHARVGRDPGTDRQRALPALSRAGRVSRRASGVARASRDPHFVAQLHRAVGRQGARRRRRFALPPRGARGGRGVCPLEGIAGAASAAELRVRRNDPYAGNGDGLTSRLRFAPSDYLGIELEIKPGHSPGRGPALDGVAERTDRYVTHGTCRRNAP